MENVSIDTMNHLEQCFKTASQFGYEYIAIKINMEGFPEPEVIINREDNFDSKLNYYRNTYDENLRHKHAQGIKIVDAVYGSDFDSIQQKLLHN
jgi:hypothetical protein